MQLRELLADEDAVSPVIGVILMVAITVILAAVIGTFVLGLGDQVSNTSPQASFTFDFEEGASSTCGLTTGGTDGELAITHDGGDKINEDRLSLTDSTGASVTDLSTCDGITDGQDVTAGTTINTQVNNDEVVRVVWEASGGGDTSTLGKWTGPDA